MRSLTLDYIKKYGVLAGVFIGIISIIPIAGGWDEYVHQHEMGNYPLSPIIRLCTSLFFWPLIGYMNSWLLSNFLQNESKSRRNRNKLVLFLSGGVLTAIAIQCAARDALVFSSELMENGKGGPLGEPSFETLANLLTAGFVYVGAYNMIRQERYLRVFWNSNYFATLLHAILAYGFAWILFIAFGDIIMECNWLVDRKYVFFAEFSHPERILVTPLLITVLFAFYFFGIRHELKKLKRKDFDVAISYSRQNSAIISEISNKLKTKGLRVYLDTEHGHESVGKDLIDYLNKIFTERSQYGIIALSQEYLNSFFGREIELPFLKSKWKKEGQIDILIVIKLDDTRLEEIGLPHALGYIDAKNKSPEQISETVAKKVRLDLEDDLFRD